MTEAIGDMSASTNQKVHELAKQVFCACVDLVNIGGGFDIKARSFEDCEKELTDTITQAIAVETAVLRDALQGFVTFHSGHVLPTDLQETMKEAQAILSAQPSPGAKAEDTASAEFYKKALDQAIDIGEYLADEVGVISDYMCCQVSDASESPDLYTYLRTKEQP